MEKEEARGIATEEREAGRETARFGQRLCSRIENSPIPVVGAVNGFALGGGCELAMACHHRVIVDDPKAVVGLPEVRLGIHPGFGGTVRAPRLAGVIEGVQMMLTGRALRPDRALRLGLVDKVVARDKLVDSAVAMALNPPPVAKRAVGAVFEPRPNIDRAPRRAPTGATGQLRVEFGYGKKAFHQDFRLPDERVRLGEDGGRAGRLARPRTDR